MAELEAPEAVASEGPGRDRRGHLRVFLGMAAGVGKTFRMLLEGHAEQDVETDIDAGARRELGESAVGGAITAIAIGDAEADRRRLSGPGVVDPKMNSLRFHLACALARIFLNASTALGNSSGPVWPPVGPPPSR